VELTEVVLEFDVFGTPVPQGSMRSYGRSVVPTNASRLRPWRYAVAAEAEAEMARAGIPGWQHGPVSVEVVFRMPRPKSHYRADGRLKETAPLWTWKRPDIDKLLRAVLDGMTDAGVWTDDSQVVGVQAAKYYSDGPPGAAVSAWGTRRPEWWAQ